MKESADRGNWTIREYRAEDARKLAELFCDTVRRVNARDYSAEQVEVWTAGAADWRKWGRSFREHYCVVAVCKGAPVGFGDIDGTGYLDRLYVHADFQRRGIGSAICDKLEQAVGRTVVTHASVTARPFFETRGYRVVKRQMVERGGILLANYVMEKVRCFRGEGGGGN